jgi:hypothetical protein
VNKSEKCKHDARHKYEQQKNFRFIVIIIMGMTKHQTVRLKNLAHDVIFTREAETYRVTSLPYVSFSARYRKVDHSGKVCLR